MQPFFKMSNLSGCALKCYLFETGVVPAGYASPAIKSFDNTNGWIQISTDNIALHGTSIELTVRCGDPRSKSAKSYAESTAIVQFLNPCFNTMIFQDDIL